MTRRLLRPAALLIGALTVCISSCVHDQVSHRYMFARPVYETLGQAHAEMKSSAPKNLVSPGKIVVYKNYLFVSDQGLGIHVFDNTNPKSPVSLSFIPLFGNSDLTVSDDILYADDGFQELVAFNIADPQHIAPVKILPGIFYSSPDSTGAPYYSVGDETTLVLSGYTYVDTTVYGEKPNQPVVFWNDCFNCSTIATFAPAAMSSSLAGGGSKGALTGSTAKFAIRDQHLYCLNGAGYLDVIDISSAPNPLLLKMTVLDGNYQTLFSMNDHLFMGAANGMFIYDATDPVNVVKQGDFFHIESCDPVIAEGNTAFVTAWAGSRCGGENNELDVLDITSLSNPVLLNKYPLSNPRGLAKDGTLLLICDGKTGLGSFRISEGGKVAKIHSAEEMETNDVIATNGLAIVTGKDGIYQYSYSAEGELKQISKIQSNDKQ